MEIGRLFRISSRSHLAAMILFFLILGALGLYLAAKFDYDRTQERARILLQKTAVSLDERMRRTVVATELILNFAGERIQEAGLEQTVSSKKEWERFRSYAEALPDAGSLWLIDHEGNLLIDSTQYPSQPVNFSDREYFAPQRDKGVELYIGPMVKGRITKKFSFTVTRRLSQKDGAFAGILVAAIETDDFTNFLQNIAIGENGAVTVWRTDGKLILRQPMEDRFLTKDFSSLELFRISLEKSPAGLFLSDKTADGIERLIAYQKMKDLPLIATTSIPSASFSQARFANVKNYSLIALLGFCVLVGLAWLVYRGVAKEEAARRGLVQAHDQVTKLNADLERRVAERTSQLSASNASLQNEILVRRKAEESLRESEARFRTFVEAAFEGIAISEEGRILDCNDQFAAIFGYERRELENFPIAQLVAPRDRDRVLENITRGRESFLEHEGLRKDGAPIVVEARGKMMPGDPSPRRLTVIRDITERKRSEQSLRISEQRVRSLGDNIPGGAIYQHLLSPDGRMRYAYMSAGIEKILGIAAERVLADPDSFRDLIVEEDRPRCFAAEEISRREGTPFDCEFRQRTTGGEIKWVHCQSTPRRQEDGSVLWDGVVVDVTTRKKAEQALQASETRSRVLSETAGRLLAADNPQEIVNELCREVMAHLDCQVFFNFLVDEAAGELRLNACAGIPGEEARRIERLEYGTAVCGCVARDGFPIAAENILQTSDPRTELVRSYGIQAYACHPLSAQGRLIGTLSFGTRTRPSFSPADLALMRTVADQVSMAMQRVRLIRELQESRNKLETRVRERTEELAGSQERLQLLASQLILAQENERKRVAVELHDGLLSELAATKYLLENKVMLIDKGEPVQAGELRRVADILGGAMKEGRRLMNNLHPSILDELGLIATLSWLGAEYQKSYPHIQVEKRIEISEEDIADQTRVVIYRVLQEALNNFARHGKGDRVEISLVKSDPGFTLEIRDNGQGFDPDKIQKGLGLESMKERVEISGGEFRLHSAIGRGTTIRATWRPS